MDSITFVKGDIKKNTNADWGLIPVVPIDPPYLFDGHREGIVEFMMKFGDVPVEFRVSDAADFFKGDEAIVSEFSTDPGHQYTGSWAIELTETNGLGAKAVLSYDLDEFKKEKSQVNSKWAWDDMNFDSGIVSDAFFTGIKVDSPKSFKAFPGSVEEIREHLGDEPVCPELYNKSGKSMTFKVNGVEHVVEAGSKQKFDDIVLDPAIDNEILVKGKGEYDICFTKGVR